MNQPYRKKMIEVALPLEAINAACADDTNRKTGHIRNIHKWFAPMPLPAWRAILFASLIDDPGNTMPTPAADKERQRLFQIIEDILPLNAKPNAIEAAKQAIQKAWQKAPPMVVDPFCGGGSTIVEAQRLGLRTFASDLNPLPLAITTALCVIPPLVKGKPQVNPHGQCEAFYSSAVLDGFKADVRYYAARIKELAWAKLQHLYPPAADGTTITSWRWAWAVRSPDPQYSACYTPLVADWSVCERQGAACWVAPTIDRMKGNIAYLISNSGELPGKTIHKTGGRCLYGDTTIPLAHIRAEGKAGRLVRHMLCYSAGNTGSRAYYSPDPSQQNAAAAAAPVDPSDSVLPAQALGFTVQGYGVSSYAQLFTPRQHAALATFSALVAEMHDTINSDAVRAGWSSDSHAIIDGGKGSRAYADAVTLILGLCVGKLAQSNSILGRWFIDPRNGSAKANPTFDRHVISMLWDFAETNPFGGATGDWLKQIDTSLQAFGLVVPDGDPATVRQMDARDIRSAGVENVLVATDPPYYGNVAYADLSDFFYMWLRKPLSKVAPNLFKTLLTPKDQELIATRFRHSGDAEAAKAYFQKGFMQVFHDAAAVQHPDVPMSIVYALKQEDGNEGGGVGTGWDAMLQGLVDAGLRITATWPMRTSRLTRMRGLNSNALASAIIIVCKQREPAARAVSKREFLTVLRNELPAALRSLRAGSVAPVDLAQASIGPGMGVFSRYSSVLEADGKPMSVRSALAMINQTLDEVLSDQEGDFDADTRWALAWFEQCGMDEGQFGVAETLSKAKNTAISSLVEAGLVIASG